jgi:hypothetical protein
MRAETFTEFRVQCALLLSSADDIQNASVNFGNTMLRIFQVNPPRRFPSLGGGGTDQTTTFQNFTISQRPSSKCKYNHDSDLQAATVLTQYCNSSPLQV